jgi:hypothetical protein
MDLVRAVAQIPPAVAVLCPVPAEAVCREEASLGVDAVLDLGHGAPARGLVVHLVGVVLLRAAAHGNAMRV